MIPFRVSARDVGAPNIDFSKGNFDGWVMETGRYYRPQQGVGATFEWNEAVRDTGPRFKIINDVVSSYDPIIYCDEFLQNPFKGGAKPMRLGRYGYGRDYGGENDTKKELGAAAERAVYKFKVEKDSTVLILNFACILHDPENAQTPHVGDQMPQFGLDVSFKNPNGAGTQIQSCASFETGADKNASYLRRPTLPCSKSHAEQANLNSNQKRLKDYSFLPWTSTVYDLTGMVGYDVTIMFYNHDCLRGSGNNEGPGGHESYGYFYVESIDKKLEIHNCSGSSENPTIRAPKGFAHYKWMVKVGDDMEAVESPIYIFPDSEDSSYVEVDRSLMRSNTTYIVEMRGGAETCSPVVLETKLLPVKVTPNFEAKILCSGNVEFTNKSTINVDKEDDELFSYSWDFGDGFYGVEENITHKFDVGAPYNVKLTAVTKNECSNDTIIPVEVPVYPNFIINPIGILCQNEPALLKAMNLTSRTELSWLDSTKTVISTEREKTVYDDKGCYYYAHAKDEYGCEYNDSIFIRRYDKPGIALTVSRDTVCAKDSVIIRVSSNVTDCSYKWYNGVDVDSIVVRPTVSALYRCEVTKGTCSAEDSIWIYVNPNPTVSILGPDSLCSGESVTIYGTGATSYDWEEGVNPITGTPIFSNGASMVVTPDRDTIFKVLGIDKYGCMGNATKQMKIKQNPIVEIADKTDKVCPGDMASVYMNHYPAHTFEWQDGSKKSSLLKTISMDETWKVKVTLNGCVDSMSIPVYVHQMPAASILSKDEICANDTLKLSIVTLCENVEWIYPNSGKVRETIDVPEGREGEIEYVATVTSQDNCVGNVTRKVKINNPIQVEIDAPDSVCGGDKAHLIAQGNVVSYKWYFDNKYFDTKSETDYIVREPVWAKVISKDVNNCSSVDSVYIDTISHPIVNIEGVLEACVGEAAKVDATGATYYEWHDGKKLSHREFIMTDESQIVTVIGTRMGCETKKSVELRALQSPDLSISGDSLICPGTETLLTAYGAESYSWGLGLEGDQLKVTPTRPIERFNLRGVGRNGCVKDSVVTVRLRELPNLEIDGNVNVCKDSMATIVATGAKNYSWTCGKQGDTLTAKITKDTTFVVVGEDEYGCQNTKSFEILPVSPPVLSYLGETSECEGEMVHLRAIGATTFEWHYGNDVVYTPNLDFIPDSAMFVKLIGTRLNCSSDQHIFIQPLNKPNILVTGSDTVCPGSQATIKAAGGVSYTWSTSEKGAEITYHPMEKTILYVTGKDEFGCENRVPYELNVYKTPKVEIKLSAAEGCPGEGDRIKLTAIGAEFYEWSAEPEPEGLSENYNSSSMEITINEDTKFTLLGRDEHECETTTFKSIAFSHRRAFDFLVTPGWIDENNPTVQFAGISPVEATWTWRPYSTALELEGRTMNYRYNTNMVGDSVSVIARAVDANGCVYEGATSLYVWKDIWAPEAFTPNGDEKNDGFRFYGGRYIDEFTYIIYNRLGEIMYEGRGLDDAWDGKWNGKECPWGVYGWVYKYKCKFGTLERDGENRGFVTLVR